MQFNVIICEIIGFNGTLFHVTQFKTISYYSTLSDPIPFFIAWNVIVCFNILSHGIKWHTTRPNSILFFDILTSLQ